MIGRRAAVLFLMIFAMGGAGHLGQGPLDAEEHSAGQHKTNELSFPIPRSSTGSVGGSLSDRQAQTDPSRPAAAASRCHVEGQATHSPGALHLPMKI